MGDAFGQEGSSREGQPQDQGGDSGSVVLDEKFLTAHVPEDLRSTPYVQGFKDKPIGELFKSAVESHKRSGSRIVKPGENATEDEVKAYLDNFRPASPDKYDVKLPDGFKVEDEVMKSYRESMHKLGASNEILNGGIEFFANLSKKGQEILERQAQEQKAEQKRALETKFGKDLPETLKLANRVAFRFGGEEFEKLIKDQGLHLNPIFIDSFSKIGQSLTEHAWLSGGERPALKSSADYQAEIDKIRNDPQDPFNQANHPDRAKRAAYVERLTELKINQEKADKEAIQYA